MKERRKFRRVNLKIGTMWRRTDTLDNLDKMKNIGEGGVCLEMDRKELNADDTLQLEFQLPTGKTVYSKAKVMWVNPSQSHKDSYRAGAEFLDITYSGGQEIRHFIGEILYGFD